MHVRRLPSWAWVAALTVVALAVVTVLAVQAGRSKPPGAAPFASRPTPAPSPETRRSTPPRKPPRAEVPVNSGEGTRIVYSLGQKRVWLVDASNSARRSFSVWPGSVSPAKGSHLVSFRRPEGTGSDGVKIENVVYFSTNSGISIAFSNAVDGSSPQPAPGVQTGGIRVRADDGDAIWKFADVGAVVFVVD
ncbi:hypothetical protein [Streptomyces sp. ISL-99]|uniref:hypothetical protein n=1 Tax=Streptomyces sp. ISL-99 TaxID=2819193 RepID=UPI0027E3B2E8|nr:hypothetical protein [Streptomyces sp. ISL-99]